MTMKAAPHPEVIHNSRTGETGIYIAVVRREPTLREIAQLGPPWPPPSIAAVVVRVPRGEQAVLETWPVSDGLEIVVDIPAERVEE